MSRGTASTNLPREAILAAGAFTALGTGAIYMWSIFNKPLMEEFGFTTSEVSMIYSLFLPMLETDVVLLGLKQVMGLILFQNQKVCLKM